MDFLSQVGASLTPAAIVADAFLGLVFAGAGRLVLLAFSKNPLTERRYWALIPIAFIIALVGVRIATPRPEVPSILPDIRLNVAASSAGDMTLRDSPPFAYIALVGVVRNLGEPSAVFGYGLALTMPNGAVISGNRQTIPTAGFPLRGSGLVEWICGDDALDRLTTTPVPRGGVAQGRLLYFFEGLSQAALRTGDIKMALTIWDVWGKETQWSGTMTGMTPRREVRNFPGLRPQPPPVAEGSDLRPCEWSREEGLPTTG